MKSWDCNKQKSSRKCLRKNTRITRITRFHEKYENLIYCLIEFILFLFLLTFRLAWMFLIFWLFPEATNFSIHSSNFLKSFFWRKVCCHCLPKCDITAQASDEIKWSWISWNAFLSGREEINKNYSLSIK